MAFNAQEQGIILYGKKNGKSRQEIELALSRLRSGIRPSNLITTQPEGSVLGRIAKDIPSDFMQMGQGLLSTLGDTGKRIVDRAVSPTQTLGEKIIGGGADVSRGIARAVAEPFIFGAKAVSTPEFEQRFVKGAENVITGIADTDLAQTIKQKYDELTPEEQSQVDNALGYAELPLTVGTAGLFGKFLRKLIPKYKATAPRGELDVPPPTIPPDGGGVGGLSPRVEGVVQMSRELANRGRVAIERGGQRVDEAALRAERLRTATPGVRGAIEAGLEERIIQGVSQVDAPTRSDMIKMLDIAETSGTKMGTPARPEIIAGNVIADQYKLVDTARKNVGKKIEEIVDRLDNRRVPVNVAAAQQQMRDVLQWNNILVGERGKLIFRAGFSPTQRIAIQQLYNEATRLGAKMTARDVYDMNKTLSALQREAKFSDVGDIFVSVPGGGTQSLFSLFKDIYANKLDTLTPELRAVNTAYRKLRTLQDDVDDSIVRGGKFESIKKGVDPAEYAQTNLRRLFSDAQSAADYRAIADLLDKTARELGYKGADARVLAAFAAELRKLYPDTIPATSFQGGISTSIRGIIGDILKTGAPNLADKQRALRALLEELGKSNPAVGQTARNLKVADKKVVANKSTPKTKEIKAVEKNIAENVEAQKRAIKAKDFELVEKLKDAYETLVALLKSLVQKVKETPNKEGGFIGGTSRGKGNESKRPLSSKSQEQLPLQPQSATLSAAKTLSPKSQVESLSSPHPTTPPAGTQALLAEARKYSTAEEFVENMPKSKGVDTIGRNIPDWRNQTVFHSTDNLGDIPKNGFKILDKEQGGYYGNAVSFTPQLDYTTQFGGKLTINKVLPDARILNLNDAKDWTVWQKLTEGKGVDQYKAIADKNGIDGVYDAGAGDLFMYNPSKVKNISIIDAENASSQLTDLWKQARGKVDDISSSISRAKASGLSFDEWVKGQVELPLNKIGGLEPQPAPFPKTKRAITEPVEVVFTDQGDFVLEAGNHRYHQAVFNGDKTIPAKIRFEPNSRSQLKAEWDAVGGKVDDLTSSIKSAKAQGKSFDEWVKGQQPEKITFTEGSRAKYAQGGHEAPLAGENAPLFDLSGKYTGNKIYPDDIYSSDAVRLYSSGLNYDSQAIAVIKSVKDRPNASLTIYRAVPKNSKGEINAGDWVTTVREYAREHGTGNISGDYKIISKNVKARDIFTDGNSIMEFGYDPQPVLRPKDMPYDILSRTMDNPNTTTGIYRSSLKAEWDKVK